MKVSMIYDMETADPDDAMTLCLLATHPFVNLRAVTVTPGGNDQIGLVRHLLRKLGREDVRVGALKPGKNDKLHVSEFHYKWLGPIAPAEPDDHGYEIIMQALVCDSTTTFLTGASLGNGQAFLEHYPIQPRLQHWVGQGGFAGDSVVPPGQRLAKFNGRETCPTFNFGGNPKAAELMLASPQIVHRKLVSKNVCHGVAYDQVMHGKIWTCLEEAHAGLRLLYEGMSVYLKKKHDGKLFHDPLAACSAIRDTCCQYAEVECYRQRGEWGSRLKPGSGTWISIGVNRDVFFDVLTARGL